MEPDIFTHEEDADFDRAMAPEPEPAPAPKPAPDPAPAPKPPVEEKPPEKPGEPEPEPRAVAGDDVKELRKQIEALNRQNRELAESERYWAGRAKGSGQPAAPPPEDDISSLLPKAKPVDFGSPEKLVEALSTRGEAALDELLAARGFARREDVITIARAVAARAAKGEVEGARKQLTIEAQIQRDFADLENPESELFVETQRQMRELVASDPAFGRSPAALLAAARTAKAIIGARTPRTPEKPSREETEDARQARIRAQAGGDRGRGSKSAADDDGDTELSADALAVAKALGVSPDEFRASRKELAGNGSGRRHR